MLVLMFIQGPLLVIWDLLVTLSSGQEPGRALAICVGESPGSPSSVSGGRTDTELPTAPSRGQKQKCRSWVCHVALVPAPPPPRPQLCPQSVCLQGAKGRARLSGQGKQFYSRMGSMLTSSNSIPHCIFPPKPPKRLLMEGHSVPTTLRGGFCHHPHFTEEGN